MAYLASLANRSFVWEDYTWSKSAFDYTIYEFSLRPTRIPLNAFISGFIAGGPALSSPSTPQAVSAEFWETACPPERRRAISSRDSPSTAEGNVLMDWWVEKLASVEHGCVEVDSSERIIFDLQ